MISENKITLYEDVLRQRISQAFFKGALNECADLTVVADRYADEEIKFMKDRLQLKETENG